MNSENVSKPSRFRDISAYVRLCLDIDRDPGLEFHGEVVIVNGDLLDQLSDEAFVEFGDFGLLTSDEVLQLGDAL